MQYTYRDIFFPLLKIIFELIDFDVRLPNAHIHRSVRLDQWWNRMESIQAQPGSSEPQ